MIKITSLQQINELVAEQLGWQLVTIKADYDDYTPDVTKWFPQEIDEDEVEQWLHNKCEEGYSYYDYVPEFTVNPHWNQDIVDKLVVNSNLKVILTQSAFTCECEIIELDIDNNNTEVTRGSYCSGYFKETPNLMLAICLAFLEYKGVEYEIQENVFK